MKKYKNEMPIEEYFDILTDEEQDYILNDIQRKPEDKRTNSERAFLNHYISLVSNDIEVQDEKD